MRRRIIICLGIILALCLLGNVIAMLCLGSSIRKLTALAESHRIQSMRAELVSNSLRIESDLLAYRAGHDHEADQRMDHIRRLTQSIDKCTTTCHHVAAVQSRLEALGSTFDDYRAEAAEFYGAGNAADRAGLAGAVQAVVDRLVRQTTAMADEAGRHLSVRSGDAIASVHQAWIALSVTLVVALAVGGIVAYHLMGRLTRPVAAMLEGIERVQQGDLTHRFVIDADEEFRTLAAAFEQAYTNLKSVQDSMIQAEKMASVGKLAAGVAHEVGNPLASISSIAQLMRREAASERQVERIDLIMEQIARISRIVRDLLSFSRPEQQTEPGYVDIQALLEQAATLLSYDRRGKKIRIERRYEPGLGSVRGDADKLLLVFTNILINAFDAISTQSDDDRGTVRISAARDGDGVVVQFEDDGPGMTDEQIAYAFEPFFTTKPPGHGTGLGLWICYQTIQRHNGSIHLQSQKTKGTTVTLHLPTDAKRE